jgi:hypothetical protein
MVVEDIINTGDSILIIGRAHGVTLRARLIGGGPDALARGRTIRLGWSAADAHVLARG